MINFIEGKICLGERDISVASSYEDLDALAEEGLIEKRNQSGGVYYYVETEVDGMRFGSFISLRDKRIRWLLLRWLDSSRKGWEDVSEKAMIDEYRLLSDVVKKRLELDPIIPRPGRACGVSSGGNLP